MDKRWKGVIILSSFKAVSQMVLTQKKTGFQCLCHDDFDLGPRGHELNKGNYPVKAEG